MKLGLSGKLSLQPALALEPSLSERLTLTHKLNLHLYAELVDVFTVLYRRSRKERYDGHGLTFEYAAVKTVSLPPSMLEFGPGFTIFRCDALFGDIIGEPLRFVVVDRINPFPDKFRGIVAVHQYGSSLGIGHKEASLLEWSIAQKEGILTDYLAWMAEHFPAKLADLEGATEAFSIMPEGLYTQISAAVRESAEARHVSELIRGFDFPPIARTYASAYALTVEAICTILTTTAKQAMDVVESAADTDKLFFAAYLVHVANEGLLGVGVGNMIPVNRKFEDCWSGLLDALAERTGTSTDAGTMPLPDGLVFALRTEQIILRAMEARGALATGQVDLDQRLEIAVKLANGDVRIIEGDSTPSAQARVGFYAKAMLVDWVRLHIENGDRLDDDLLSRKFRRAAERTAREFENHTGYALFSQSEKPLWLKATSVAGMYKVNIFDRMGSEKPPTTFRSSAPQISRSSGAQARRLASQ